MSQSWNRAFLSAVAAASVPLLASVIAPAAIAEENVTTTASAEGTAQLAQGHPKEWALLDQQCSKCHNSVDWAGGVAFDTLDPANIPADAEVWEKAIRKLRGRMMPPPGEPQPDQQTVDAFVSYMEGVLDRTAAENPSPGNVGLHRLNRTEYAREIERLLGLQVDVTTLLPKDVSSDGFDNIAAVLRISPAFVDQYISAARTVSRMAIGRATAKSSSVEYRATGADQFRHIDGLPLGTRGGILVEHYFPADGEYEFDIRDFFFMGAGYVNRVDHPHKVIMTIDDVRVFEETVGGPEDLKAVDQRQAAAADELQARFNDIRVRIKAGMHKVGIAFVQRSLAQSDSPLQPIAVLPEMERFPTIPGVHISGPFNVTGVSETESRRRIFICRPTKPEEELPCARRILGQLAQAAFRRPITDADLGAPLSFYKMGREAGDFETGIESGLTAILSSTKFLFRTQPGPLQSVADGSIVPIPDLELASRLSFFLWSEGPDRELIELAAAGRLSDPEVLDAQVHRLFTDPRSDSLVTNFAFQWLNVNKIATSQPDPVLYPDFDPDLREGFREEMRLFLDHILRGNQSVLELLRSDQTFLNERLALHYGVPNVRGAQFRPVRLTDPNRRGLLGKGAILMGTSYGNRTSPVLRGAWILETITGTPPSAPPPGVEQFPESEPGRKPTTVRERLEQHRTQPSCNGCHGVIDPLGFALENFDVVGAWREKDRDAGTPIDSSGQLADGRNVSGPAQLSEALLARPDQFVQALTEKLMVFALGRGLRAQDMPAVRGIVRQAANEDYRFEAIIRGIVRSQAFRSRELSPAPVPESKQAALSGQESLR